MFCTLKYCRIFAEVETTKNKYYDNQRNKS